MTNPFEKGVVLNLPSLVAYSEGGVVSKQILKNEVGNITLFSFDTGSWFAGSGVFLFLGELRSPVGAVEFRGGVGENKGSWLSRVTRSRLGWAKTA